MSSTTSNGFVPMLLENVPTPRSIGLLSPVLALQGRQHVPVHHTVEFRGVHETEGSRRAFPAQPLVTCRHHDGLGQLRGLFGHLHGERILAFRTGLVGLHAHIAEDEHGGIGGHLDIETTIDVGHGRIVGLVLANCHAVEWLAFSIGHHTCHGSLGLYYRHDPQKQHRRKQYSLLHSIVVFLDYSVAKVQKQYHINKFFAYFCYFPQKTSCFSFFL